MARRQGGLLLRLPTRAALRRSRSRHTIPTRMDELLEAVGVPTVDYPLKTKCCGGTLTGTIHAVGIAPELYPAQRSCPEGRARPS